MSRRSQRRAAARSQMPVAAQPAVKPAETARDNTIPPEVTAMVTTLLRAQKRAASPEVNPFALPAFPPRAVPEKVATIAQDEAIGSTAEWAAEVYGAGFGGGYGDGVQFLGFPILAEMTQRPEYRKIADTWATESVRKWIAIRASGDADKADKVKQLEDEFDRLKVRESFRRLAEQDAFFGRAHLFLDFGAEGDAELTTSVGDGTDATTRNKVGKGSLKRLKVVEALWCYPSSYNTTNPLAADWYAPSTWYVQGKAVHATRLLTLIAREVSDLLKPTYSFGGLSMSQMARPYVDTWLRTRQAVSDLIVSFSHAGIKIDLSDLLKPGGAARLANRIAFYNTARENGGLLLLDKGGGSVNAEDFFNIETSLGTLDKLQAQAQEQMASVSSTPLVKLLGITPSGLNASSDGEIRVFYDSIHAYQNSFMRPTLSRVFHFAQISLWGAVDPDLSYDFVHLWSQSESELATIRKTNAETDQILIDSGVLSPSDARKRIAEDADTPYHGLDADELPDLHDESEEGLEPEGRGAVHSLLGRADKEEGQDGTSPALARLFDASRRARIATDAEPATLYVNRPVENAGEIIAWAKAQGITKPLAADDLHVTVAYSKRPLDWCSVGTAEDKIIVPRGGPRGLETFGDGAVVLMFSDWSLSYRHDAIREAGASWDHSSYQPHITITYEAGDLDLSTIQPYQGRIILGPEIFARVNEDWEASEAAA